jgi:hypothetical protein
MIRKMLINAEDAEERRPCRGEQVAHRLRHARKRGGVLGVGGAQRKERERQAEARPLAEPQEHDPDQARSHDRMWVQVFRAAVKGWGLRHHHGLPRTEQGSSGPPQHEYPVAFVTRPRLDERQRRPLQK